MAKVVREPLSTIYAGIVRYKFLAASIALATVILLVIGIPWKAILFFPPLFLIAAFSTFYKRLIRVPPAFELISLTTIAVGMTHGPWAGAIFGATSALAAEVINSGVDAFIVGYVVGRAVMGALAGMLAATFLASNIVLFGMALTLLFNLIAQSLYLLQGDPEAKVKTAVYVTLNMGLNWIIFSLLGRALLTLLG
ncbi:TPA: hypothetical protein HA231_04560 [Candidatus Woesearchaeota archaeon]|nr:hypothetical protein [Candidatus Woesearchaeota archaeon]